jgi:nucleoid-associated protein YgaU
MASRYLSSSRYTSNVTDKDGFGVPSSTRKSLKGTYFTTYVARESDTFDLIANRVLGDPALYWKVADLNPHVPFPDTIPAGTRIRVPKP